MAKKPSRTAIWKKAAKDKLDILRSIAQWPAPRTTEETDIAELEELIPRSRRFKNAKGRSGTWFSVFQNRILVLMRRLGKAEYSSKRSFVMLKPNLKMSTGDAGVLEYGALVEKYGKEWVDSHVTKVEREFPEYEVRVHTFNGLDEYSLITDIMEAHVEMEYIFTGKGTTAEELDWTETLGNKIAVEVSDIPARFKKGEKRKGK